MFSNKKILFTGATSGIGLAILNKLLKEYYNIKITVLTRNDYKNTDNIEYIYLDLSIDDSIIDLTLNETYDFVFFNAGVGIAEKNALKINFINHIKLFNHLQQFNNVNKESFIINTSSRRGLQYDNYTHEFIMRIKNNTLHLNKWNRFTQYCLSKKGNHAFTIYLTKLGFKAISVHPGAVNTKIFFGKKNILYKSQKMFIPKFILISPLLSSSYFFEALNNFENGKISPNYSKECKNISNYIHLI